MHDATLCILLRETNLLLGMKKRGFGKDRFNGFGGRLEPGETIEQAAVRELAEEAGVRIDIDSLKKVAELTFEFSGVPKEKDWDQVVHVYVVRQWKGEPTESDEMRPAWFPLENIPYSQMWPDDSYWLPHILKGKYVKAKFIFGADQKTIIDYSLNISD